MIKRDLPGYAIGGLAGGEDKHEFWKVVHQCTSGLPDDKPRYLMGVGYPIDLLVCVALGVDMFDCVWPCRTARFGTAIVPTGLMPLRKKQYEEDLSVIDPDCACSTCKEHKYSRAYLHHMATKESLACHLITIHNLHYMHTYMRDMRNSIKEGTFEKFVFKHLQLQFPDMQLTGWVFDALTAAKIDLSGGGFARSDKPEKSRHDADLRADLDSELLDQNDNSKQSNAYKVTKSTSSKDNSSGKVSKKGGERDKYSLYNDNKNLTQNMSKKEETITSVGTQI
jgi:hypothetical protein